MKLKDHTLAVTETHEGWCYVIYTNSISFKDLECKDDSCKSLWILFRGGRDRKNNPSENESYPHSSGLWY